MKDKSFFSVMRMLLHHKPEAAAVVKGSEKYPGINGTVSFYRVVGGVIVRAQITGLPKETLPCNSHFFGFHIHSGNTCTGNDTDPFANADGHYDPHNCPHPYHAGDLPPLLNTAGSSFSVFLTDKFSIDEVLGRTVIIHGSSDDFTTQPAGNAGEKIACGEIRPVRR